MLTADVTWADALQAIASALGFSFLAYQLWAVRRTLRSDTHDRLYVQYLNINTILLDKPYLYKYFYENYFGDEEKEDDILRVEIELICEQFCALFEHAEIEKNNLMDGNWRECWKPYILERFEKSGKLVRYFIANRSWYTKSMNSLFDSVARESEMF